MHQEDKQNDVVRIINKISKIFNRNNNIAGKIYAKIKKYYGFTKKAANIMIFDGFKGKLNEIQ